MSAERLCKQCGGPKVGRSVSTAVFCMPCSKQRNTMRFAAEGRKRVGYVAPLKLDGRWCCLDCKTPLRQLVINGKKRVGQHRCDQCRDENTFRLDVLSGRQAAATALARAIGRGDLPRATGLRCADCGGDATCYDHRDYGYPLQVDPVCQSCNVMRGPALPVHSYFIGLVLTAAANKNNNEEA